VFYCALLPNFEFFEKRLTLVLALFILLPILKWYGKDAVINHDKDVPFRLLEKNKSKSIGNSENLIIEGDNLEALKALLPKYEGKFKIIYIDPPYNTGAEEWIYNDNVESPIIKKWLGKVVGPDSEDLTRHDKWLCMMYPRLKLLKKLLCDDGIIFVSIDDNESSNLKLILDEILGAENYLSTFYIQVRYAGKTLVVDSDFQKLIEQVYVYGKSNKSKLNRQKIGYSYEKFKWKIKETGKPQTTELGGKRVDIFKKDSYEIIKDKPSWKNLKEIWASGKILDGNSSGRFFRDYLTKRQNVDDVGTLYKVYDIGADSCDYRYFTGPKRVNATKGKYYQGVPEDVIKSKKSHQKLLPIENFLDFAGSFGNCRHEGKVDFRSGKKPIKFLMHLFQLASSDTKDDLILDSFAGSGSTGHAVIQLNENDSGDRKFVLIELESKICREKTSVRISNVINELKNSKSRKNLGFQYAVLDKKLFNSDGRINDSCTKVELASYIYFTETKTILDTKTNKTLIGTHNGTDYHLIFNGIDKNILDRKFLVSLDRQKNKVIYADKCTLDDSFLEKHNTIFKQIPYEVREF
jgi:adenine-specific DNA-methyltransferase